MPLKVVLIILIVYAIGFAILLARKAPQRKSSKPISRGWGNRLRILIIGATGRTGREFVWQALEQGHQVTALVRKPKKMKLEHPNLRVIKGNVADYASIESAMRGQSAGLRDRDEAVLLSEPCLIKGDSEHSSRDEKLQCAAPGLRKFARRRQQCWPARADLHVLCRAGDFTVYFLRQSPPGKIN